MEVSDKLAVEFNTILLAHSLMLLLLTCFTSYVYFRAKKTPLLYGYLSVVAMITLWMVAKILKTVSPVIELRWFFIVIQYLSVDSLGVCLLLFAYIYRKDRLPSKKLLLIWSILPAVSFLVLLTNPLHMTFYSYFDIYKDQFGPAFYLSQSVQYLYLLIGILSLSRGFTKQPGFVGKKSLGIVFAAFVLLPLLGNAYYILFKMNLLSWVFPFPVFDFTPIAASLSLMLFIVPALTFRFFDISPISLGKLYNIVPQGLVFLDKNLYLYGGNQTFFSMMKLKHKPSSLAQLLKDCTVLNEKGTERLLGLVHSTHLQDTEFYLADGRLIRVIKRQIKKEHLLLCISDITKISQNRQLLSQQNRELEKINVRLSGMADTSRALAVARTKSQMAQYVHDILGHCLTVVTGTAELASSDVKEEAMKKTDQIEELLIGSLNDLQNALSGKGMKWGETMLIKAIQHLKNENTFVDIQIHGKPYELNGAQTETMYRLCQEAVTNAIKHGKAKTIYLILRFHSSETEIYAIDNGSGCKEIKKNYGLTGIEARIAALSGRVSFTSDGESGFTIYASLPKISG